MSKKGKRGKTEESGALRPLHGGRHGIDAETLAHNQRERLIGALATVVGERGYKEATITGVTDAASVSLRTFYEHFDSVEECFAAAYEALDGYLATEMAAVSEAEARWPDRVAAAFEFLVGFLASRPNFARFYLVEAAVVGEAMASAREETAQRLIGLLEEGRGQRGVKKGLGAGIEEGLVGGILTLLARRVNAGEAARLDDFLPAVLAFALTPYLGFDGTQKVIAAREAKREAEAS